MRLGKIKEKHAMKRNAPLDPQTLDDVLSKPHQQLGRILHKAKTLKKLQDVINKLLPKALQPYVEVMNIDKHHLVLCASNGTYASALRMHHDRLLAAINRQPMQLKLEGITIKVRPS
jgi:hypothetical protein